MKIVPDRKQLLGRIAEITRTAAGIELPTAKNNTTIFVLIDETGPDCSGKYKKGDIVLPKSVNHIYLRDGHHQVLVDEETVYAHLEDVPVDQLTIS